MLNAAIESSSEEIIGSINYALYYLSWIFSTGETFANNVILERFVVVHLLWENYRFKSRLNQSESGVLPDDWSEANLSKLQHQKIFRNVFVFSHLSPQKNLSTNCSARNAFSLWTHRNTIFSIVALNCQRRLPRSLCQKQPLHCRVVPPHEVPHYNSRYCGLNTAVFTHQHTADQLSCFCRSNK